MTDTLRQAAQQVLAQPVKRVELTDEEIAKIWHEYEGREFGWRALLARAVIAAYERKNGIGA